MLERAGLGVYGRSRAGGGKRGSDAVPGIDVAWREDSCKHD